MSSKRDFPSTGEPKRLKRENEELPSIGACRQLLGEWLKNPSKVEWVPFKIYFPELHDGCLMKSVNEDRKDAGRRTHRAKVIASFMMNSNYPTHRNLVRGYINLHERGAPLSPLMNIVENNIRTPEQIYPSLLYNLATWNPSNNPIVSKGVMNKAPKFSLDGILPSLKTLKVKIVVIPGETWGC